MAFKEVFRVEILELVRRWQAGASLRGISRATGFSRDTVRKYVLAAQRCGLSRDGPPATEEQTTTLVALNVAGPRQVKVPTDSLLNPWSDRIGQWIQRDHLKATRVQELLAREGCVVSYSSLQPFVARRGLSAGKGTTVRRRRIPGQEKWPRRPAGYLTCLSMLTIASVASLTA